MADCYLAEVCTRRMDKLVKTLRIDSLSTFQVSRMAAELDQLVDDFRHRPLGDAGPLTFVAADALTMKVREGGRVINAVVLIATGVNSDGHREVLGVRVATSETGAACNEFFADLVARGLTGVQLMTSDAHAALIEAIAANLPGASWQRCRTHYSANLMPVTPKSMWPAVKAILHSVYDQPDAPAVHAQFDRLIDYVTDTLPAVAEHLVISGPAGTGKTHFVGALAHEVIDQGMRVSWFTLESLTTTIGRAAVDGTISKVQAKITRAELIVIDDIGMLPSGQAAAKAFYRLIDATYERRSLAVTSNTHSSGYDTIMPKTLATAAVDRLLRHAHVIITEGTSPVLLGRSTKPSSASTRRTVDCESWCPSWRAIAHTFRCPHAGYLVAHVTTVAR